LTLSEAVGYTERAALVCGPGDNVELSVERFREAILFLIALVLSVSVHEFGHAWAANRLGDPLPRAQGRLTLNPVRHIDPIGTLLFPLIMVMARVPLLGWGRPVMTNPSNYRTSLSRPTASMLVALAGPAMNLLMAAVVSLLLVVGVRMTLVSEPTVALLIDHLVVLNLSLLFFNLLPIPPLDGGAVLAWALPRSMQGAIEFLERWGFIILFGLVMIPQVRMWVFAPAAYLSGLWTNALLGALA
jgi:Zn-dependent protease